MLVTFSVVEICTHKMDVWVILEKQIPLIGLKHHRRKENMLIFGKW